MDIAARIKQIRGKLSQDEFSERVGVHKNSVGRYERGDSTPDLVFAKEVCTKFGVLPEWLLLGTGPMRPGEAEPPAPDGPAAPLPVQASGCVRCTKLEARLDDVERERRELTVENRNLWKENGELRERCARLEERQSHRRLCQDGGEAVVSA